MKEVKNITICRKLSHEVMQSIGSVAVRSKTGNVVADYISNSNIDQKIVLPTQEEAESSD